MLQCGSNIPSCIATDLPIHEVCVFYMCNHIGSRVSNWISIIVKLPRYMELVK